MIVEKWMGDQTEFRVKSKLRTTKRNLAFSYILIMSNTGIKVYLWSWEQFCDQVQFCSRAAKILGAQIKKVRSTD